MGQSRGRGLASGVGLIGVDRLGMGDLCGSDPVVFFFQAEDGIRDIGVTGVQTCALPISKEAGESIVVMRGAAQGVEVAVKALFESGDPRHNVQVHPGDIVTVRPAGLVYVVGIGRASWRGRGEISVVGGSFKKKIKY